MSLFMVCRKEQIKINVKNNLMNHFHFSGINIALRFTACYHLLNLSYLFYIGSFALRYRVFVIKNKWSIIKTYSRFLLALVSFFKLTSGPWTVELISYLISAKYFSYIDMVTWSLIQWPFYDASLKIILSLRKYRE